MLQTKRLAYMFPILLFCSLLLDIKVKISVFNLTPTRLVVVAFFLLACFAVQQGGLVQTVKSWSRMTRLVVFMLLFWLFYGLLGLLWTVNRTDGIRELMILGFNILIVLTCIFLYREQENQKILFRVLKILLVAQIILMGAEMVTGLHLPLSRYALGNTGAGLDAVVYVPTGISYNENDQSLLMLLFLNIPLAELFLILRHRKKQPGQWLKKAICPALLVIFTLLMLYSADSFIIFVSMLITLAAASVLALPVIGFGLLAFLTLLWKIGFVQLFKLVQGIRPAISNSLSSFRQLLAQLPIFKQADNDSGLPANPTEIYEVGTGDNVTVLGVVISNNNSLSVRVGLIKEGFRQFISSFGRGVGANGFKDNIQNLEQTKGMVNPHCWFIEILSQYGIFVFLAYTASLVLMLIRLLKSRLYKESPYILGAILILVSFVPGSFAPSQLIQFWPQWFFFGVAAAIAGAIPAAARQSAS